jgi:hypothetical protein
VLAHFAELQQAVVACPEPHPTPQLITGWAVVSSLFACALSTPACAA